jgi:hypothetical protein
VGTIAGLEKAIGLIKDYLNKYIEEE